MSDEQYKGLLFEILSFLYSNFSNDDIAKIICELKFLCKKEINNNVVVAKNLYENIQTKLSSFNEVKDNRKSLGAYYTPIDIINFMLKNALKQIYNFNDIDISNIKLNDDDKKDFALNKSVFDPSCGNGEFLLYIFEQKHMMYKIDDPLKILKTIFANDIDKTAVFITKIRLFLAVLHYFGTSKIKGVAEILNKNITNFNFFDMNNNKKYDIIIGNPPYIEFQKAENKPKENMGNIYAIFLSYSANLLKNNGIMAFIIPISYISTKRMAIVRNKLNSILKTQVIYSFADRPDCLFAKVHQKLNIFIGKNDIKKELRIFTSAYKYWYKDERKEIFDNIEIVKNNFIMNDFIAKLGNEIESSIYKKIISKKAKISDFLSTNGDYDIFLNMRASFWVKAFLNFQNSREYKNIKCDSMEGQFLLYCLFNSSLFWFFWICVSDCWHITSKELELFKIPNNIKKENINLCKKLGKNLIIKLEKTKKFIGSKQTDYEYKHKFCLKEINEIDDLVAVLYDLNNEENSYIKNFAIKYRTSGEVSCIA